MESNNLIKEILKEIKPNELYVNEWIRKQNNKFVPVKYIYLPQGCPLRKGDKVKIIKITDAETKNESSNIL